MRIINRTKNTALAESTRVAGSIVSRMVGLLNRSSLPKGEALLITRCRSIHMVFMRFSIDVVFIDKKRQVVGCVENIKPFQFSPVFFKATDALELPAGTITKTNTTVGDQVELC